MTSKVRQSYSSFSNEIVPDLSTADVTLHAVRVFQRDGSYRTVTTTPESTCSEILIKVLSKFNLEKQIPQSHYSLELEYTSSGSKVATGSETVQDLLSYDNNDTVKRIYLSHFEKPATHTKLLRKSHQSLMVIPSIRQYPSDNISRPLSIRPTINTEPKNGEIQKVSEHQSFLASSRGNRQANYNKLSSKDDRSLSLFELPNSHCLDVIAEEGSEASNLPPPIQHFVIDSCKGTSDCRKISSQSQCSEDSIDSCLSSLTIDDRNFSNLKSSASMELLTTDAIGEITEYSLTCENDCNDSKTSDSFNPPFIPPRVSSLLQKDDKVPDFILIQQGKRLRSVLDIKPQNTKSKKRYGLNKMWKSRKISAPIFPILPCEQGSSNSLPITKQMEKPLSVRSKSLVTIPATTSLERNTKSIMKKHDAKIPRVSSDYEPLNEVPIPSEVKVVKVRRAGIVTAPFPLINRSTTTSGDTVPLIETTCNSRPTDNIAITTDGMKKIHPTAASLPRLHHSTHPSRTHAFPKYSLPVGPVFPRINHHELKKSKTVQELIFYYNNIEF
jgi:hypothetical protein